MGVSGVRGMKADWHGRTRTDTDLHGASWTTWTAWMGRGGGAGWRRGGNGERETTEEAAFHLGEKGPGNPETHGNTSGAEEKTRRTGKKGSQICGEGRESRPPHAGRGQEIKWETPT